VGAPTQLGVVAATLLVSLINHEYQHDCWIGEMRALLGCSTSPDPLSMRLTTIDGYLVLDPFAASCPRVRSRTPGRLR
jgi:hypothetical protein